MVARLLLGMTLQASAASTTMPATAYHKPGLQELKGCAHEACCSIQSRTSRSELRQLQVPNSPPAHYWPIASVIFSHHFLLLQIAMQPVMGLSLTSTLRHLSFGSQQPYVTDAAAMQPRGWTGALTTSARLTIHPGQPTETLSIWRSITWALQL